MKITVPAVRFQEVGVRYNYGTDVVYHAEERPNVYAPLVTTKVVEPVPYSKVVFDHDFKLAQRATAVGRLLLLTAAIVLAAPVGVTRMALEALASAFDRFDDKFADLVIAAGAYPSWTLQGSYAALAEDAFGK